MRLLQINELVLTKTKTMHARNTVVSSDFSSGVHLKIHMWKFMP